MILFSMVILNFINIGNTASTIYQVDPNIMDLGEEGSVLGAMFTVNIIVTDATNLYGFSIDFSWNTTYLDYYSHTTKIPVETYPDGVLHEPIIIVSDTVDAIAGTYELAVSTLGGDPFNGNGIVFEMTFMIKNRPYPDEVPPAPNNYVSLPLHLDVSGEASEDGEVRVYAPPPSYPPYPMLKVMPEIIGGKHTNETFPVDVWLMGERELDLECFFDVCGAEICLNFNSSLIEAKNVTLDPYGWFTSFWPSGIDVTIKEINNTAGTVRVFFNTSDEWHYCVHGRGLLFRVEFKAVLEITEWPPLSCIVGLKNLSPRPSVCGVETPVYLEGYQHTDRPYCPWNSSDSRVPLPHSVENATYFAGYEPGILLTIHSPEVKNYSREAVLLNVTANIPIENWWYSINSSGNISFTSNLTLNVLQCENNLTIYASSSGMIGFSSI
jgi:hypothetical protein